MPKVAKDARIDGAACDAVRHSPAIAALAQLEVVESMLMMSLALIVFRFCNGTQAMALSSDSIVMAYMIADVS